MRSGGPPRRLPRSRLTYVIVETVRQTHRSLFKLPQLHGSGNRLSVSFQAATGHGRWLVAGKSGSETGDGATRFRGECRVGGTTALALVQGADREFGWSYRRRA